MHYHIISHDDSLLTTNFINRLPDQEEHVKLHKSQRSFSRKTRAQGGGVVALPPNAPADLPTECNDQLDLLKVCIANGSRAHHASAQRIAHRSFAVPAFAGPHSILEA